MLEQTNIFLVKEEEQKKVKEQKRVEEQKKESKNKGGKKKAKKFVNKKAPRSGRYSKATGRRMTVDIDECDHCNPYSFVQMSDSRYYKQKYIADARESHKAANEKGGIYLPSKCMYCPLPFPSR